MNNPAVQQPRVLLVEDNTDIRRLLARILRMNGLEVHDFPDAESAIDYSETEGSMFDVLITDLILPGMTGKLLDETLRARGAIRRTILISGYADDLAASSNGQRDGVDALHKPFEPDALIERVNAALAGR